MASGIDKTNMYRSTVLINEEEHLEFKALSHTSEGSRQHRSARTVCICWEKRHVECKLHFLPTIKLQKRCPVFVFFPNIHVLLASRSRHALLTRYWLNEKCECVWARQFPRNVFILVDTRRRAACHGFIPYIFQQESWQRLWMLSVSLLVVCLISLSVRGQKSVSCGSSIQSICTGSVPFY